MDETFMRGDFGTKNHSITVRLEHDYHASKDYAAKILQRVLDHLLDLAQGRGDTKWGVPSSLKGELTNGIYTIPAPVSTRQSKATVMEIFDALEAQNAEKKPSVSAVRAYNSYSKGSQKQLQ
jgi:hypothetical protein